MIEKQDGAAENGERKRQELIKKNHFRHGENLNMEENDDWQREKLKGMDATQTC